MIDGMTPGRAKRPSRYAQLEGSTTVVLDNIRRERLSQIFDGTGPDGQRVLHIRFPTPRGRESMQVLDASDWLVAPEIAHAVAEMFIDWGGDKTEQTRFTFVSKMTNGFFTYLTTLEPTEPQGLANLTTSRINGFIDWLSRKENGAFVLASYTRLHYLGGLRMVIEGLKKKSPYSFRLPHDLHVRRNPWPGISRTVSHPTEILSRPVWETLYRVCVGQCSQTMSMLERGWTMIEAGRSDHANGLPDPDHDASLESCLRRMDRAYPAIIPSRAELHRVEPALARMIRAHCAPACLSLHFQPTARSLIPFLLLLAMTTFFSGDVLLGCQRSDLFQTEILGTRRFVWRPYKGRSHRRQYRSFAITAAPDNPAVLIPFIERWTARIRWVAEPRIRDHVFLWIPSSGRRQPRTFETKRGSTYGAWEENLTNFLRKEGLPHVNLRQIRATGLDLVHELFAGDLLAIQAVGGQQRPEVIQSHYTSDAARQRNDEQLGAVMALRARWRETDGALDSRGLPLGQDVAAATPGWRCLDPYDSPIPGQEKGRLCAAYGACPACPFAHLNLQDPSSLVRVLQLRARMEAAQGFMPAQRWLSVWAPRLHRLVSYWLPCFQDIAVIEAAERLDLDDLPDLE